MGALRPSQFTCRQRMLCCTDTEICQRIHVIIQKNDATFMERVLQRSFSLYDLRNNNKKGHMLPNLRSIHTGKGDEFGNSSWVPGKLQSASLSNLEVRKERYAIMEVIKSCGRNKDIQSIRRIHADKHWITDDIWIANTLIRSYAKCGALKDAQEVFEQITKRDVVSWNALIAGYVDQGIFEGALTCFREMESDGVMPDSLTYAYILKACAIEGALDIVEEIHAQVMKQGLLKTDIVLRTTLINGYAKCSAVKQAREVFEQVVEHDVVLWSALIDGYVEQGFGEEALKCFTKMESDGVIPNTVTYISILKASSSVGALGIVKQIHSQVTERQLLKKGDGVGNSLLNAYAKCGDLKEAQEVFDLLEEWDVVSWSTLINGYVEQGFGDKALACFRKMQSQRFTPNSVTYICCLKACATVGALEIVEEIHAQVRDNGLLNKDIVLGTKLVHAYAKCGVVSKAREVFDQLTERDVHSWNAVVSGYSQLSLVKEMSELLNRMIAESIFPDPITFLVILNGCNHGAQLEEGQMVFDMIGTYDFAPTPEHHTCMVDLFCRVGQFDKVKPFMLHHTSALRAYLGACRKWENVDLGICAFDKLMLLDPKCASAYVSMGNIYGASDGMKQVDGIK